MKRTLLLGPLLVFLILDEKGAARRKQKECAAGWVAEAVTTLSSGQELKVVVRDGQLWGGWVGRTGVFFWGGERPGRVLESIEFRVNGEKVPVRMRFTSFADFGAPEMVRLTTDERQLVNLLIVGGDGRETYSASLLFRLEARGWRLELLERLVSFSHYAAIGSYQEKRVYSWGLGVEGSEEEIEEGVRREGAGARGVKDEPKGRGRAFGRMEGEVDNRRVSVLGKPGVSERIESGGLEAMKWLQSQFLQRHWSWLRSLGSDRTVGWGSEGSSMFRGAMSTPVMLLLFVGFEGGIRPEIREGSVRVVGEAAMTRWNGKKVEVVVRDRPVWGGVKAGSNGSFWGTVEDGELPKRVVDSIEFRVNGQKVPVEMQFSSFADLGEPHSVWVVPAGRFLKLVIRGADAGASYVATLLFERSWYSNGFQLIQRHVASGEMGDQLFEQTTYSRHPTMD